MNRKCTSPDSIVILPTKALFTGVMPGFQCILEGIEFNIAVCKKQTVHHPYEWSLSLYMFYFLHSSIPYRRSRFLTASIYTITMGYEKSPRKERRIQTSWRAWLSPSFLVSFNCNEKQHRKELYKVSNFKCSKRPRAQAFEWKRGIQYLLISNFQPFRSLLQNEPCSMCSSSNQNHGKIPVNTKGFGTLESSWPPSIFDKS